MEKYGRARQVTDDDIIRRMRFACWIAKAADTCLEYVKLNCVSMARMVSRTRLSITFIRTLSVMLIIVYVLKKYVEGDAWSFPLGACRLLHFTIMGMYLP